MAPRPDDMDAVFEALAHADRRRILDILKSQPGCCVNDVAAHFATSRIAVMKHLKVLETAGLLVSKEDGRFRRLHFNAVPIQMIYDRWTSEYSSYWTSHLARVKYAVEMAATPDVAQREPYKKRTNRHGRKR